MLSRIKNARRRTLVLTIVALLGLAGGAYAFWTAAGTGSVSGDANDGGTITLSGTIEADTSAPGVDANVEFTASNPTTSAITVGTVKLRVLIPITVDAGHAACDLDDFSMADVVQGEVVAAGAVAHSLDDDGTLVFDDTGVNQDACKGATLTLHLIST